MIQTPPFPPLIVGMGVTGCGTSTVGEAIARQLDLPFADGDDLHPASNIARMAAGTPLDDDDDRRPWLQLIGAWLALQDDEPGLPLDLGLPVAQIVEQLLPDLPHTHPTVPGTAAPAAVPGVAP